VEILQNILLALHLLGMATIVGVFLVQLRAKSGHRVGLVLGGAITQVVTGIGMIGLYHATHPDAAGISPKLWVHLGVGLAILAAAIAAFVLAKQGRRVNGAFHAAGGLAVVNVLIAAIWPA